MKKHFYKSLIALSIIGLIFTSCKDDDKPTPPPNNDVTEKYLVMTLSEGAGGKTKEGYLSVFDKFPSGEISNVQEKSLTGGGMGGLITFEGMVFRRFNKNEEKGVHKLTLNPDNTINDSQQILVSKNINGSGNFAILNANEGFYFDGDFPTKIQKFNPTTMTRTGELGDYTDVINERGETEEGINFRAIGQHFLVVKDGKLFADLTYGKNTESLRKGVFDDFYNDVYIAVINLSDGKFIKTTKVENSKAIAYINENLMYSIDQNGDLYFLCQGNQIGGLSKIARIKKGNDEVDNDWILDLDIINPNPAVTKVKFTALHATEGRIITLINTEDLTGGPSGNINSADIWKMYSIDINTKAITPIEGLPNLLNSGASSIAFKMDGKLIIRATTSGGNPNGYFELNGNTAKELFRVTEGGKVQAFVKIK